MLRSAIFISGFSLVFILLGLTVTAIGSFLLDNSLEIRKFTGVAIIALGVFFAASVFVARLNRDWRPVRRLVRPDPPGTAL